MTIDHKNRKAKGSRFETQVRDWLKVNGYPGAERFPAGARLDRGDISGVPGVTIECKSHKSMSLGLLGGFMDETEREAEAGGGLPLLLIKRPGKGSVEHAYAVVPLGRLWELAWTLMEGRGR